MVRATPWSSAPTRIAWLLAVLLGSFAVGSCGDDASSPTSVDPPGELGPHAIGHTAATVVDARRANRTLPVDVWYPADADRFESGETSFYPLAGAIGVDSEVAKEDVPASPGANVPLLVFSHGFEGIRLQSIGLMEALASHGFVVATIGHVGNSQSEPGDDFDTAASQRVPDVSVVIDAMFARSRTPGDLLSGLIDTSAVGVLGHSFGGMTSLGMAAGWAGAEPDLRVGAIFPISAVIDGDLQSDEREGPNAGFSDAQLSRIRIPVMLVGGTADVNVPIGNNEIAFRAISNAPVVYKLELQGANHNHFASVCAFGQLLFDLGLDQESWPSVGAADLIEPFEQTCGPDAFPIDEVSRLVRTYAVSFFRFHLRDDAGYERFLTLDYADLEPAASLSVR